VSIVRLLLFSYCHIDFFSVWVSATALSCPSTPRLTLQKVPRSNLSATAVLALQLAILILVALKLVLQKNCLLEQLEIMCTHPATHRLSEDSKGAKQSSALSGSIARMLESIMQQQEGRQQKLLREIPLSRARLMTAPEVTAASCALKKENFFYVTFLAA